MISASGTTVTLASALIAAVVSLLVALASQLGLARRDQRERRYQRRRASLLEVQNAALDLRQALAGFGVLARAFPGVRSAELLDAEREFDRALAVLEVRLSRLESAEVRELVTQWRLAAQVSFISVHDVVSRPDEQRAWAELNTAIGAALGDG
jgi:hypothetical protein